MAVKTIPGIQPRRISHRWNMVLYVPTATRPSRCLIVNGSSVKKLDGMRVTRSYLQQLRELSLSRTLLSHLRLDALAVETIRTRSTRGRWVEKNLLDTGSPHVPSHDNYR